MVRRVRVALLAAEHLPGAGPALVLRMLAYDETTAMIDARAERLPRVLGDELRRARKRLGWTRKDLLARLGWDASLQTLATYELGTRTLSVARFVELADALGVSVVDVLTRTLGRIGKVEQAGRLEIDLRAITGDRTPELAPLRRWAHARLRQTLPGRPMSAQLDQHAIVHMSELCGIDAEALTAKLWNLRSVGSHGV